MTPFPSANHLAAKIKSKPQKQKSLKADILRLQISLETQNLQVQATALAFQIRKFFPYQGGHLFFLKYIEMLNHCCSNIGLSGTLVTSTPMRRNVRSVQGQGTPGTALSHGMGTHSLETRNQSMRIPQLKGKSQLNQIISELNGHLNPLSEHLGAYSGQAEKAITEGNL